MEEEHLLDLMVSILILYLEKIFHHQIQYIIPRHSYPNQTHQV